ncbi:hypothetical protein JZK55_16220 [Dissulfurispira thermophila]|uniref:DUF1640 domain-containing protein n=2 Tax=root TaxID=1 RepID=A0A7G1H1K9_9BACT|nr:DUF1640 domain-containing protein [Dissulfurispira thermophila]BCB96700.1 hypothetical protein JZK55_16220 [Dissulfurispira thermophila]
MATAIFDTLAHAKKLREAGFSERQAEIQAEALAEIVTDHLVTKGDLQRELKDLECRLIIKLGAMMATSIVIVATLVKLP